MKSKLLVLSLAFASSAALLRADEATDALANAKSAYEAGNYSEAIQQIDFASTLIRQKKAEAVVKLLPNAPSGWVADEAESVGSQGMLGGIVGAQRSYRRDSGGSVKIDIQSDSPLIQSMGMMFANPMLLAGSGAKLESHKGQKLAVDYKNSSKSGDVKAVVDNRYLVSIDGSDLTRDELLSFAKSVDYARLAAMK